MNCTLRYFTALCFCLFTFANTVNAQTKTIDGLKNDVGLAQNPHQKLMALFAVCEQRQSLSTDTLCKYAYAAKEISLVQNDTLNMAMAEHYVATCFIKRGDLDSALKICQRNIDKIINQKDNAATLMKLTAIKAQILIRKTKYKEGIAEVYKLLNTAEEAKDTLMQMVAKNALGWVNMEMDQTSEALRWFHIALNTSNNKIYHEKNSNIYSNIAAVHKQLHQNDSAEYYVRKSIAFSRKSENLFFLANCLNILADIYIDFKRPSLAEAPLTEALAIRKQIGDPFYIVSDLSQLAIYYANILDPAKGISTSLQGIDLANKMKLTSKLPYLYHALGQNYKAAGDYTQYSNTLEKIMLLKDSMNIANSAEARAEMDTRYNLAKKENLIILQKLDISKKNSLFYGALILLVFTFLISWILFRGFKKNQQIKLLKMQAEEKQSAARAVYSAEEKERKRISRDLHDNIGAYATVLLANAEKLKNQATGNGIQQTAENVSENAQSIMGSIQETIWVLNNDVITITDFSDRVKVFSKKMLKYAPGIQITFNEQLNTNDVLSPAEALHLFRIMQEAMQNTIKHAKPENITVSIKSGEALFISIKDDGIGFKNNVAGGNGLVNMQHRAKEAGYQWNIFSMESGTEITLQKNHSFAV